MIIQLFEGTNLKELNALTNVRLVQLTHANRIDLDGTVIYNQPYDFVLSGDPRSYGDLLTPAGLAEIAIYADAIGPWKRSIVSVAGTDLNNGGMPDDINGDGVVNDADKHTLPPSTLIDDVHKVELLVTPYTFRNEHIFLAQDYPRESHSGIHPFFQTGGGRTFYRFPRHGRRRAAAG